MEEHCPRCEASDGRKLVPDRLATLAQHSFVWGSVHRFDYGDSPGCCSCRRRVPNEPSRLAWEPRRDVFSVAAKSRRPLIEGRRSCASETGSAHGGSPRLYGAVRMSGAGPRSGTRASTLRCGASLLSGWRKQGVLRVTGKLTKERGGTGKCPSDFAGGTPRRGEPGLGMGGNCEEQGRHGTLPVRCRTAHWRSGRSG